MDINDIIGIIKTHRLLLICIMVMLLLNFVFYFTLVKPQQNRAVHLQQEFSHKRAIIQKHQKNKSKAGQSAISVKQRSLFMDRLPPNSEFAQIAGEISDLVSETPLASPLAFKPQKIKGIDLWQYTTQIHAKGSYRQLKTLLAKIQNSKRILCIDKFEMHNKSEDNENIQMKLDLSTYLKSNE